LKYISRNLTQILENSFGLGFGKEKSFYKKEVDGKGHEHTVIVFGVVMKFS
jgi:hypothetical protein